MFEVFEGFVGFVRFVRFMEFGGLGLSRWFNFEYKKAMMGSSTKVTRFSMKPVRKTKLVLDGIGSKGVWSSTSERLTNLLLD